MAGIFLDFLGFVGVSKQLFGIVTGGDSIEGGREFGGAQSGVMGGKGSGCKTGLGPSLK